MSRRTPLLIVLAGVLWVPSLAQSQENRQAREDRQGRAQARRRGGFDPAEMRNRMMNDLKEQLGASDDEWKTLVPKIEKVMTVQRELQVGVGGPGGWGPPGGPGGPGGPDVSDGPGRRERDGDMGNWSEGKVAQARRELRRVVESRGASAAEISAKLAAYRKARQAARAELENARKDLVDATTPQQEAVLVIVGLLE